MNVRTSAGVVFGEKRGKIDRGPKKTDAMADHTWEEDPALCSNCMFLKTACF